MPGDERIWSLFDRSMISAYHKLSKKHLPRYLDECAFRFNNRQNEFPFRDMLRRLVAGEAIAYEELTA